jgi:hypothetical protein
MPRRPAVADVREAAEAMLVATVEGAEPSVRAAPALRLGGGTQEGQAQVNLMLSWAFAEILDRECPSQWRTSKGVPDVQRLAAVEDDESQVVEDYARLRESEGSPASRADGKAALAAAANAAVLAQQFLDVRQRTPQQLLSFAVEAERRTGLMVNDVWGALMLACSKVRSLPT